MYLYNAKIYRNEQNILLEMHSNARISFRNGSCFHCLIFKPHI